MLVEDPEEEVAVPTNQVTVGSTWEVAGPFPSGMREHPFIASPLHAFAPKTFPDDPDVDFARRPYVPTETWPSELGQGGRVGWKRFRTEKTGWLEVYYPDIRWDQLRSDRGWASLQYQVLLRTTITIPLQSDHAQTSILIDVIQGTEYAFIPLHRPPEIPTKWYNGDVYDFASTPTGQRYTPGLASNIARTVSLVPGVYTLIVRAHYETRLFGDPDSAKKPERGPVIRLKVQAEVEQRTARAVQGLRVVPDVVDRWFSGDWMSVGLRAGTKDVTVERIVNDQLHGADLGGVQFVLKGTPIIRAGQVRNIALRIYQAGPIRHDLRKIEISLAVREGDHPQTLHWQIGLQQRQSNVRGGPYAITFASPCVPKSGPPASISYATLIPPTSLHNARTDPILPPVILALHGAGVDASSPFWADAIPKRETGWAVLPTGRTEWGEDWHDGSMADAWAAREAVPAVVAKMGCRVSADTLLIGHSNGGQGAWHLAARYPDRIVGGWLTIHDYVPYTEQCVLSLVQLTSRVSNHYADPALMGILRSSLTPYDNDLHASNLVGIPVLAIHGADDDNVTPRHSRAHIAAIANWAGNEDRMTLLEIPKKGHFWADIFKHPKVAEWMDRLPCEGDSKSGNVRFTLTCANPLESAGRGGVRILELETPGQLARLSDVSIPVPLPVGDKHAYTAMNVRKFGVVDRDNEAYSLTKQGDGWQVDRLERPAEPIRAYGPMIRLLATDAVFTIIYGNTPALKLLGTRLAHDLLVYHRIDTELLDEVEGRQRVAEGEIPGSLVCLGRPDENEVVEWMLGQKKIPIQYPLLDKFEVNGTGVRGLGTGFITLHPHPCRQLGLAAIIAGNDVLGTELAARLFPLRTGVMVPDWAVVSPAMMSKAAGGLIGAGFYGHDWSYNKAMSWLDGCNRETAVMGLTKTCRGSKKQRQS